MTKEQSDFFKKNIINMTTIITLIGFIINQSKWQERTDNRIDIIEKSVIKHHNDKNEHMPFERKIEIFVPRIELDSRLNSIESTLTRIEKKINK